MLFSKQKISLLIVFLLSGGALDSKVASRINKPKSPYRTQGQIVQPVVFNKPGASILNKEEDASSEWLFLIYIAARNNLAPYAAENLKDIAENLKDQGVHALVQWDQVDQKGAWRYYLKNGKIDLIDYSNVQNPRDAAQKMVDFVSFGLAKYPSKKIAVVFWNHGSGALDFSFGDPLRVVLDNTDMLGNPAVDFSELWSFANNQTQLALGKGSDKAILFDEVNKTCINNKQLRVVFEEIYKKLGRKIDLVGFDACYGAMTECAYSAKDYAEVMVASQELELAKGWNYAHIMKAVNNKPTMSSKDLACEIVKGFENSYKAKTPYYTQSAVDLTKLDEITTSLDAVVLGLQENLQTFGRPILNALFNARKSCLQFSVKMYVDLCSMLRCVGAKILSENLGHDYLSFANSTNALGFDEHFLASKQVDQKIIDLLAKIRFAHGVVESAVFKNVSSNQFKECCGLSIYFPTNKYVDPSYANNIFTERSLWRQFLTKICGFMN